MQTLLGCSTMSARKKCSCERDIPLYYTTYHFSSSVLDPTVETIYYEFVTEFKNFLQTRILAYCVGMRAERNQVQTTVRGGCPIFTFLADLPCIFDTLAVTFDMTIFFREISLSYKGRALIPSDIQGFYPSQKTVRNSQLQVMT